MKRAYKVTSHLGVCYSIRLVDIFRFIRRSFLVELDSSCIVFELQFQNLGRSCSKTVENVCE